MLAGEVFQLDLALSGPQLLEFIFASNDALKVGVFVMLELPELLVGSTLIEANLFETIKQVTKLGRIVLDLGQLLELTELFVLDRAQALGFR